MRRRIEFSLLATATAALLLCASAQAAPPTVGSVTATDIQGVSALLKGTVDPEGLATTYRFEYSTAADFAGAIQTASAPAGSVTEPRPARAVISGLSPSTTYHFRLVATNGSETTVSTPASFTTTSGFGFLPGTDGFAASAYADGGAPANRAGEHPYQLDFTVGLNQGGEFEGQPGAIFSDGCLLYTSDAADE